MEEVTLSMLSETTVTECVLLKARIRRRVRELKRGDIRATIKAFDLLGFPIAISISGLEKI